MEIKYELDKNESIYDIGPGQYADSIFKSLGEIYKYNRPNFRKTVIETLNVLLANVEEDSN